MKTTILVGAVFVGLAGAAIASPAQAQQSTGLYVSAGAGGNWADSGSFDSNAGSGDFSFDAGPGGVVALGYDWGTFRTEAEVGLRTNDVSDIDVFDDGSEGHQRTLSGMVNALVDLPVGPVTLYGGGGLGVANVEWDIGNPGYTFHDFDTVMAWQGIAGLAYDITPQLAVTGEYRYFSSFEDLDFRQGGDTIEGGDFGNHSALIGLRYTFAAPSYAMEINDPKSYLVFFDFDSSQLTADARSIVATAAADALAGGSPRLDVTGHTDRSGSDAYNQALSIRRATAVQDALIADGVPAEIIVIRGAGEAEPLVPTADGVREPQNRRVEIVIG
jgi:OOP family OmpA-OmpF porin